MMGNQTAANQHTLVRAALQRVVERIRMAYNRGERLQICGAGSKDFYCGNLCEGDTRDRLDACSLSGIVNYEPSELVASVWAGTPLAELETTLAAHGQCLPFDPPHFGAATVGGMVAAGLAGPARANAGSVRDHVLGVQMINGRGQLLNFGGTVIKNVAGYDVSRVLVGSLGTLGMMTQIHLKVLPLAPAQATLRFALPQREALARLHAWGGLPLPLNASSWCGENGGILHLRLRGAQAAVDAASRHLGGERLDEDAAAVHWQGCREQSLAWFGLAQRQGKALWRLSVPQTAPVLDVLESGQCETFIEWHGGQRWVKVPAQVSANPVDKTAQTLRRAAKQVGGHATLFRTGQADAPPPSARFEPLSPTIAAIHQALKREFDPQGVFPDLPWRQA